MSRARTPFGRVAAAIATALLALYPLAFKRRYRAEMEALIQERFVSPATLLDLLRGAIKAHISPPPQLELSVADRLRASTSAVLACWVAFAAAGFGFYKTTESQPFEQAGYSHQLLGSAHGAVQALAGLASVAILAGALPIVISALLQARARPRLRPIVAVPPLAALAFVVLTALLAISARSPVPSSRHLAVVAWAVAGLLCGAACVVGARLALFSISVRRETLAFAMGCATCVTAAMATIAIVTVAYAISLHLDAPRLALLPNGPYGTPNTIASLIIQAIVMALLSILASVATRRGWRALHYAPAS